MLSYVTFLERAVSETLVTLLWFIEDISKEEELGIDIQWLVLKLVY